MAPLRIVDPEGVYHVMSRGNYRNTIFPSARHAERYLFLLGRVTARRGWIVLDWCLMPNHYHLLIRLTDGGLSAGMRELNGCYSRWSNALAQLTGTGHLVRNRFKSLLVDNDPYLFELLRYIPNNPVRGGLVDEPADWPWSGYRATAGHEHPRVFHRPSAALAFFDSGPRQAQEMYRRHVARGPDLAVPDPWSDHDWAAA